MCSPDTIDLIPYDDGKNKKDVEKLKKRLEKRKQEIQETLDRIKTRFKLK